LGLGRVTMVKKAGNIRERRILEKRGNNENRDGST
jgi:hypothetical protein